MSAAASTPVTSPPSHLGMSSSTWNEVSSNYEKAAMHITAPQAKWALQQAMSKVEGEQLVIADIACGSGAVALEAAALTPRVSNVIASDYSEEMCKLVDAKADAARKSVALAPIRTLVADAAKLEGIPDASCDISFMVFGLMMMPDPQAAAREMVRITKPGGLIVIQTWSTPDKSQFHGVMAGVMKQIAKQQAQAQAPTPAPTSAPAASESGAPASKPPSMNIPFNTIDSLKDLYAKLPVELLLAEEHAEQLSRTYPSAAVFWEAMVEMCPLPNMAKQMAGNIPAAIEVISAMWGGNSTFSLHSTSILTIARKRV